ncbi:MAG: VWA domain-containing protein [Pyrinomonadaceae bacterium]
MMKAIFFSFLASLAMTCAVFAQKGDPAEQQRVRTVSIPISIFTKAELRNGQAEEFIQADRLIVKEDRDEQTILSIRSVVDAPLALAILIQDDLSSNFNLQLSDLRKFIRSLPRGSRVMVAYLRGGQTQIRQRFTTDLYAAANSLRIVASSSTVAPRNPFDSVVDALNRFDALPAGRRALLLISDGLDSTQGLSSSSPSESIDLERAISRAQRRNVAVFSIYNPASLTERGDARLVLNGQGSLAKLADETGGRAFFQGSTAINFDPFFRDLNLLLNRQFLLSYLSTHMKRGYHRVEVFSTNPDVKIEHPKGYYFR